MTDKAPKRMIDDPKTDPAMKVDLRNSSELRLSDELAKKLERIERGTWSESEGESEPDA